MFFRFVKEAALYFYHYCDCFRLVDFLKIFGNISLGKNAKIKIQRYVN